MIELSLESCCYRICVCCGQFLDITKIHEPGVGGPTETMSYDWMLLVCEEEGIESCNSQAMRSMGIEGSDEG